MHEGIHEKVSVIAIYDGDKRQTIPYALKWRGQIHKIVKVGYHHTQRSGRTLQHIFSVVSSTLAFRLNFDTDTLSWTLEEISDGAAD